MFDLVMLLAQDASLGKMGIGIGIGLVILGAGLGIGRIGGGRLTQSLVNPKQAERSAPKC